MTRDKHDLIFKLFLSKRKNFVAFCQTYLPSEIKQKINWDSIELFRMPNEHVRQPIGNRDLNKSLNDIAYMFKYDSGQPGLIIVHVEHQSYWDRFVKLRLIQYVVGSLLDFHDKYKSDKLPLVIPIVFYHGQTKINAEDMDLYDLFLEPDLMKQYFTKPLLVDLSNYDEMDLIEHPVISPLEVVMKHATTKTGDLDKLKYVCEAFRRAWDDLGAEDRLAIFNYLLLTWDIDNDQLIAKIIQESSGMEDLAMTAAEQLLMRGRQEGRHEKSKEMVHKLVEAGIDIKTVQTAADLSDDEMKTILKEDVTD